MSATATIDLSAIPEAQREAVDAVLRERDVLREANRRLEHLVAELNHAVHGKRSEKLNEDDRQLAFEDLETSIAAPWPIGSASRHSIWGRWWTGWQSI